MKNGKIMKRIFFIAAIGLAIFSGCIKDDREYNDSGGVTQANITVITATTPDGGNTKLALSGENHHQVQWTEGDIIFIAEVESNTISETFGLSAFVAKTVAGDGKSATFEMHPGNKPLSAGRTYIALHKENLDVGKTFIADGKITHNVPTNVTQDDFYGVFRDIDSELFFISAPVAAFSDAAPAFAFKHVMSMFEFEIWTDEPEHFSGFQIDKVTVQASTEAFVEELTCEADGYLATGKATDMLTAYLRKGSVETYTLNAEHQKLRMPVIWNLALEPLGDFTFTLHPSSGEPIVFTRQAKKLETGMIYRIQMEATYFPFEGSGTESDPYLIPSVEKLAVMRDLINAADATYAAASIHWRLTADLSLSENWSPIGSDNVISFKGNFDGNSKTISNVTVNRPSDEYNGFFGYVSGTIKNLGLINVKITGGSSTGGLAGSVFFATISNCYVTGEVTSALNVGRTINSTGGLAGSSSYSTISNCYTLATVTGETRVGGVAGDLPFNATISNCYATGVITGTDQVGGIAGRVNNNSSTVKDCAALNPMLIRTGSVLVSAFGRVAGYNSGAGGGGALTNNAAWSDMSCNVTLGDNNNTAGIDINATTVTTDGTLEGRFTSSGGWTTDDGSLPGLFGTTVVMPAYFLE